MIPLIFLPGMMCDARLFAPQIAAITSHEIQVRDIGAYDNMTAIAHSILADAPPIFALAGLSMGGIVAMEMMRLAPDRIARIALMDTNPQAERAEISARRFAQMEAVKNGKLRDILRDELKPNYLVESPQKQNILDLCMDMGLGLGAGVFLRQSVALRDRLDQQDTLRAFKKPALVLCGRHDMLCPIAYHELMHDLLENSHLEIIENAGHMPTLEQAQATNKALINWLEA
ncbi:MAG: alpha/beta fold hydrolase [Alphaproteobacteria bacterium]